MLLSTIFLFLHDALRAQQEEVKNQSPYFIILNEDSSIDQFSLEGTKVEANIAGFVADVKVTQSYSNDGEVPIEAIYVFPGSTRSAIYEMQMKVGDRIINAEIKEKQRAKQEYNAAKSEGKRASLLEQHNPNVFQMNVANILPGDKIEVSFKYNEFLVPEEGEYSFVFPTVVGPRFSSGNTPDYVANPYLKKGTPVPYRFDINVHVQSPTHVQQAICDSHPTNISFISESEVKVHLKETEEYTGDRDFIFNYKINKEDIATGTMVYEHDDENFFLSIIQPPECIEEEDISPREYIFIVDVSGSMHGFPLDLSKSMMSKLLGKMRPQDKFNVMLFASSSIMLSQMSMVANEKNIEKANNLLQRQGGGGGTQLLDAVQRAMKLPKINDEYSRSFVILTDGYVHVERETFDFIQDNLNKANFFAFGIGSSVNRYIIEGIAHQGRAEAFILTDQKYSNQVANKFNKYIESPILTNINLTYNGIDVYDTYPAKLPDLMAERPLYVFGKYKGKAKGNIEITGKQGTKDFNQKVEFSNTTNSKDNESLRYLWAREKLRYLSDYNKIDYSEKNKEEITNIGLKYNLLTEYTSFLAVDNTPVVDNAGQVTKTVKQALPLPSGVTNSAIGFAMGAEAINEIGEEVVEEELFAVVNNQSTITNYKEIEQWFKKEWSIVDGEVRDLLSSKELTLVLNREGNYELLNANWLTEEQIKILEKHLIGLTELTQVLMIKVTLLWL